ncbi:MAG: hypothetical protein AAAB35_23605 [Phyllobacterium sp.]|uniref:hypothetical protein n=1 Tax=Phyllobacterium sp. TaxID=1871046 RepID=UPI0030F2E808
MANWLNVLREKNELATVLGKKIPKMLAHEALSLEQVTELYKFLESHARGMEEIRAEMEGEDLPESYYQVAEDLDLVFTDLAATAAERLRDMRTGPSDPCTG